MSLPKSWVRTESNRSSDVFGRMSPYPVEVAVGQGLRYQLRLVTTRVNHNAIVYQWYQYRSWSQRPCIVHNLVVLYRRTTRILLCVVGANQSAGVAGVGKSPTVSVTKYMHIA